MVPHATASLLVRLGVLLFVGLPQAAPVELNSTQLYKIPAQHLPAASTNAWVSVAVPAGSPAAEDRGSLLSLAWARQKPSTKKLIQQGASRGMEGKVGDFLSTTQRMSSSDFWYVSVLPLILLTLVVAYLVRPRMEVGMQVPEYFFIFKARFLLAWGLAVGADSLQNGVFLSELFKSYSYTPDAIEKLYLIYYLSAAFFGVFVGSLADAWGRKKGAMLYCGLCCISCMSVHNTSWRCLVFGRVLGGMSSSLLYTNFECWMVSEAAIRNVFGSALLRHLFSCMYFVRFITLIGAGLVTQILVQLLQLTSYYNENDGSDIYYGGNCSTFDFAALVLILCALVIGMKWEENTGEANGATVKESFVSAFRSVTTLWRVGLLCFVLPFFEAAMYIYTQNWNKALSSLVNPPPLGVVFSTLMMAGMVGAGLFSFLDAGTPPEKIMLFGCLGASVFLGMSGSLIDGYELTLPVLYYSFLAYEAILGLVFPALGMYKSDVVPEEARVCTYSMLRAPLNFIVILMLLYDSTSVTMLFYCSCGLCFAAAVFLLPMLMLRMPSGSEDLGKNALYHQRLRNVLKARGDGDAQDEAEGAKNR